MWPRFRSGAECFYALVRLLGRADNRDILRGDSRWPMEKQYKSNARQKIALAPESSQDLQFG